MSRVVVTGMGAVTALGQDWSTFRDNLRAGNTGIRRMDAWDCYQELNTRLGGPIVDFETPAHYPRKKTRSMGRVSLLATRATETALEQSGLLQEATLTDGNTGVAYGSCSGTPTAVGDFGKMLICQDMTGITATTYIKLMSHTAAINIGIFFGLKGRIHTTSSACTSGSQGIGYAYESIKWGKQLAMVGGGAEELCASQAAVFDTLYATCLNNDSPEGSPKPFDAHRDGLVIGEGAGSLILENYDHARARGANIFAEVVGYGTTSDGGHVTQPAKDTMAAAMRLALEDAGLQPADIGYISAHGTATDRGDLAESLATEEVFQRPVPISTLKGHLGHTLGGCGAIEAWAGIEMMNDGWFNATLNLEQPDPECGDLDYIMGAGRELDCEFIMSNNFAFGGINTSLIFKRC